MRIYQLVASAFLVASFCPIPSAADPQSEFNLQQFAGWGSVYLRCGIETGSDPKAAQICAIIEPEFRYRAELASIPNAVAAPNADPVAIYAELLGLERPLVLNVNISSVGPTPAAIYARVWAGRFVSHLDLPQMGVKGKTGDLEIWDSMAIGAGPTVDDVAAELAPVIDNKIKSFFADFLPAWRARL